PTLRFGHRGRGALPPSVRLLGVVTDACGNLETLAEARQPTVILVREREAGKQHAVGISDCVRNRAEDLVLVQLALEVLVEVGQPLCSRSNDPAGGIVFRGACAGSLAGGAKAALPMPRTDENVGGLVA